MMLATLTQLQALFWELQNPTAGSWGDAGCQCLLLGNCEDPVQIPRTYTGTSWVWWSP